jgi:hypothetical protein
MNWGNVCNHLLIENNNSMKLEEFKNHLMQAHINKTLLIGKHDPNNLGMTFSKKRSVISHQVVEDIPKFIREGIKKVFEHENFQGKYYEVVLTTYYEFASSGVSAYSQVPEKGYDRVVAVKGKAIGWHIYGEDSCNIEADIASGNLRNKVELD